LWRLATRDYYRSLGFNFDLAKSTIRETFYDTLFRLTPVALEDLSRRFAEFRARSSDPSGVHCTMHVRGAFPFPFLDGGIDGTHIPVEVDTCTDEGRDFINRKSVRFGVE
jgi:hypothetical protein